MKKVLIILLVFFQCMVNAQFSHHYMKAIALIQLNHSADAISYLDTAITNNPEEYTFYLTRASVYFQLNAYDAAMLDYLKVEQQREGAGLLGLSRCYAAKGMSKEAVDALQKHLMSRYRVSQKEIKMDSVFNSLEKQQEWKQLWQQEWYSKYDYVASEAAFLISQNENIEAINLLTGILKEKEKKHELLFLRAKAYFAMNEFAYAFDDLSSAIEISKRNPEYYAFRANVLYQMKKHKASVEDYAIAIKIDPYHPEYYLNRAIASSDAGLFDEAVADLKFYAYYMSENEDLLFIQAELMYKKGDVLNALSSINKAIEKNKNVSKYYVFRADCYVKINMPKYAVKDYSLALDLENKQPEVWERKGWARYNSGDKNGACHDWSMAIRLGSKTATDFLQQHCIK